MTAEPDSPTRTLTRSHEGRWGEQTDRQAPQRPPPFGESELPPAIDRFVVLEELGAGGMGRVYLGQDLVLGREVALKILDPNNDGTHDEATLWSEAQAMAQLSHPNVVPVYTVGKSEGRVYIAMERIAGVSLRQWLAEHRGPLETILSMHIQAGEGLVAMHSAGLIHGDFKPSNVMVEPSGRARVVDLGLAGPASGGSIDPDPSSPSGESSRELLRGTPRFMAPEQFQDGYSSPASDQYSFCVALYFALHGRYPAVSDRNARSSGAKRVDARQHAPERVVPKRIERAIERGLAPTPTERWPSMRDLLDELQAALRARRRRRSWITWGAVGALVGLAWAGLATQGNVDPCAQGQARLRGAWDDTQRTRVRDALQAPQSGPLHDIVARLDQYADEWLVAHAAACQEAKATDDEEDPTPSLVMRCLDERRSQLRAYVDVLATTEDLPTSKAVEVLDRLEPIESCLGDTSKLETATAPIDPTLAAAVEDHRVTVQRIVALSTIGNHSRALEVADELLPHARALDFGPLVAEILIARGEVQRWLGHFAAARQDLEDAYFLAKSDGNHALMSSAANELMLVVGVYQGDYEAAEDWKRHAFAALSYLKSPKAEARYYEMSGGLFEQQGRLDEAMVAHDRALEIIEEHFGTNRSRLASALYNAGLVLLGAKRYDDAAKLFSRCIEIAERTLGAESTRVATCHGARGDSLLEHGKLDQAEKDLQRSVELFDLNLGPDNFFSPFTLDSLGQLYQQRGQFDEAKEVFDRALAVWERQPEPDPRQMAYVLTNRGRMSLERGDLGAAQADFERAYGLVRDLTGEWSIVQLDVLESQAMLAVARREHAMVQTLVDDAKARGIELPERRRRFTQMLEVVAKAYEQSGDEARAAEYRERRAQLHSGER